MARRRLRGVAASLDLRRAGPVTLLGFVGAAGNLLAGVIVARGLEPADRGFVAVVVTTAGLVGVLATLGTNVSFRAHYHTDERIPLGQYVKGSLILLGLICVPGLYAAAAFIGAVVDARAVAIGGAALFIGFGIVNFAWFQASEALRAIGEIRHAAYFDAGGSWCQFAGVLVLGLAGAVSVTSVLGVYIGSFLAQFSLAAWRLVRCPRASLAASLRPRRIRFLLATGPRYLGFHFGQDLVYRLDRVLLGWFSSVHAVGLYVVASTPAELMRRPVLAAAQYAMLDASSGSAGVRTAIRRAGLWTGVLLLLSPAALLVAPYAIEIIYGPDYSGAVPVLRVLILAQVALAPFLIFSRALAGLRHARAASISTFVGAVAIVVLGSVLMPRYGAVGGAAACLVAFTLMSVASGILLRRVGRAMRVRDRKGRELQQ